MSIKIVMVNGSSKRKGNTYQMLSWLKEVFDEEDIDVELIEIGGYRLAGCRDCLRCVHENLGHCAIDDDKFNEWMPALKQCDGLVLGSPTYFTDVTPEMKAFIDRSGRVARAEKWLRYKVGAAVVAQRRMGAMHAFDTLNHFFLVNEMMIPGANYWNMGLGGEPGEVLTDEQAKKNMEILAHNIVWLVRKIR